MRKKCGLALIVMVVAFVASPLVAAPYDAGYFEHSGPGGSWGIDSNTGITDISSVSTRWNSAIVNNQTLYNATLKSGGFGALVFDGSSWTYSGITTSGNYVASAYSGSGRQQMLLAKADGGVEYWSRATGAWAGVDTGITGKYTSLSSRGLDINGRVLAYATKATGGIDHLVYTGTEWLAAGVITSSQVYNSIAAPQGDGITEAQAKQYLAAKADGGVDYIYHNGSGYVVTPNIVADAYVAIGSMDVVTNGKPQAYAARADGGIDILTYNGTAWVVVPIIDNDIVYGSVIGGVNDAVTPLAGRYSGFATVVPEPATLTLIAVGGVSALLKRRRK